MLIAGDGSSGYGGRSIEKEKEKKKPQNSVLGERREKRTRKRKPTF